MGRPRPAIERFLRYLSVERNASDYTLRNYRDDLLTFFRCVKQIHVAFFRGEVGHSNDEELFGPNRFTRRARSGTRLLSSPALMAACPHNAYYVKSRIQ